MTIIENGSDANKATLPNDVISRRGKIQDGGYGWIITFASFMCHFIADGIALTFGVIYPDLLNAFGNKKSTTSWIGSLFLGIPLISGPVAGLFLSKYGCRRTTIMGGIITSIGMLLSAFAGSVETLAFTYGVVSGFGLAFIYVPASVIPSFWFEKRRSLATGIAVAGSGLGTFTMAPLTEYLIAEYGWRGTLLIMSAITLNFVLFGALFRDAPFSPTIPKVSFDFAEEKSMMSNTSSADDNVSHDMGSCHSFKDLNAEQDPTLEGTDVGKLMANTNSSSPIRKHHSTNTIYTGEEFDSLYVCATQNSNTGIEQVRYSLRPMPSAPIYFGQLLLRSRHSLLPVSRHDITSVMNLAISRRRTISSCPELSITSDDEEEGNHHTRSARKRTKANKIVQTIRHIATEMCDIRLLAVPVYLLFFIANFMLSYAYDLPYIYLPDYAASLNITKSSFLISIIGIVNTFGQILFGYLGDKECINIVLLYGVSLLLCGVFVAALPAMQTYLALASFSAVFGLLISANFSLETVVLVKILSLEQLTKAYGLLMFGQGIASLIGPPIGGLLWDISNTYLYTFIFSGVSMVISGILAVSIVFVRGNKRSRTVSESADIASPPTDC